MAVIVLQAYYVLGTQAADRGELTADRGELTADRGELTADRGKLPAEIRDLVAALGPRPRRERLRAVILRLCELRFWRPSELTRVLRLASPEKLVERHLAPMCSEGLLVRRFPDRPQHPDQAYQASQGAMAPIDGSGDHEDRS